MLEPKPSIRKVRIRGTVYTLRELTVAEYDECSEKAKEKRENPLTGRDEEVVNNTTLLRMMVAKATGISIARQADLDMPVLLTLNALVNEMSFPATDATDKNKLWEEVEDDEEDGGDAPAGGD